MSRLQVIVLNNHEIKRNCQIIILINYQVDQVKQNV